MELTSTPSPRLTALVRSAYHDPQKWNPERWSFQAGYSHNVYFSGSQAYTYLNRSSEYLFSRAGWRFAEATQAGLEASSSITAYEFSKRNDNYSISLGPYAEWQARPTLKLTLRGGPTVSVFSNRGSGSGGSSLNSYYVGLEAAHELTRYLSHHLSIVRDVQAGLNEGSAYIEQLKASYFISLALTDWINLSTSVSYENGNQPLPVFLPGGLVAEKTEKFDVYRIGPQLNWHFTQHFSGTVAYNHSLRQSNFQNRNYVENSVSITLGYTF